MTPASITGFVLHLVVGWTGRPPSPDTHIDRSRYMPFYSG